ncbi:MAG TPA: RsmE family RNA methyltransferase [Acidimicrobiales bacterium]
MVAAHLFVADLDNPEIDPRDRHHVERVLRLRAGEAISVSDGLGGVRPCVLAREGDLDPTGAVEREARPSPLLTVGFALVKGDRPEWIVQKLTECGIDRIVPFVAARSVVRWDESKAERNLERFRTVAREAAMQSRRTWLPEVCPVLPFAGLAGVLGGGFALADGRGDAPTLDHPAVLVGPEGGWTDAELAFADALVRLGSHVYRAETAAIAAGVTLAQLRQGLVKPGKSDP